MPEVENAMLLGPDESRAEDNIGPPFQDGSDQSRVFLRAVFEIRILNDHDGRGSFGDASAQSRTLSAIDGVAQNSDARVAPGVFLQDRGCAVLRAVINADQLGDKRLLEHRFD